MNKINCVVLPVSGNIIKQNNLLSIVHETSFNVFWKLLALMGVGTSKVVNTTKPLI